MDSWWTRLLLAMAGALIVQLFFHWMNYKIALWKLTIQLSQLQMEQAQAAAKRANADYVTIPISEHKAREMEIERLRTALRKAQKLES